MELMANRETRKWGHRVLYSPVYSPYSLQQNLFAHNWPLAMRPIDCDGGRRVRPGPRQLPRGSLPASRRQLFN